MGEGCPSTQIPASPRAGYPGLPARLAPRLLAAPTPAARGRSRQGRAASSAGEGALERWRGAGRAAPTSSWRARLSRKPIPWRRGCARRLSLPPHRPGIASEHRAPCGRRRGSSGGHSFRPPPTLSRQGGRLEDAIRSTPPEVHSQPALSCSAYFPAPPPPARCRRLPSPLPEERRRLPAGGWTLFAAPSPLSLLWTPRSHPAPARAVRAVPQAREGCRCKTPREPRHRSGSGRNV